MLNGPLCYTQASESMKVREKHKELHVKMTLAVDIDLGSTPNTNLSHNGEDFRFPDLSPSWV